MVNILKKQFMTNTSMHTAVKTGDLPPETFFEATPSSTLENALLQNGIWLFVLIINFLAKMEKLVPQPSFSEV